MEKLSAREFYFIVIRPKLIEEGMEHVSKFYFDLFRAVSGDWDAIFSPEHDIGRHLDVDTPIKSSDLPGRYSEETHEVLKDFARAFLNGQHGDPLAYRDECDTNRYGNQKDLDYCLSSIIERSDGELLESTKNAYAYRTEHLTAGVSVQHPKNAHFYCDDPLIKITLGFYNLAGILCKLFTYYSKNWAAISVISQYGIGDITAKEKRVYNIFISSVMHIFRLAGIWEEDGQIVTFDVNSPFVGDSEDAYRSNRWRGYYLDVMMFAIAHELSHHYLGHIRESKVSLFPSGFDRDKFGETMIRELEADMMAVEILLGKASLKSRETILQTIFGSILGIVAISLIQPTSTTSTYPSPQVRLELVIKKILEAMKEPHISMFLVDFYEVASFSGLIDHLLVTLSSKGNNHVKWDWRVWLSNKSGFNFNPNKNRE